MDTLKKPMPYYEQIYHTIKQMIMDGLFEPGERLFEAEIARRFEVSRSPVREAVRALITDGLLTMDDKSQISVYNPSLKDVKEIYQCRMALESFSTRLATSLMSDEEMESVAVLLKETECLITEKKDENKDKIIKLNGEFHDLLTSYCKNKRIEKQINDLKALTNYFRRINFQGKNRMQTILDEHKGIFYFMERRDADGAQVAMEKHIERDLYHLKKILE